MAKKKKPTISLEGLDDVVFDKKPDITAAQSILETKPVEKEQATKPSLSPSVETVKGEKEKPAVSVKKIETLVPENLVEKKTTTSKGKRTQTVKAEENSGKGTPPPEDKKRASFNIPKDLHRAIKDYSYFNEIDMVEYIFEQLVKPDLKKKGYYPPKKRRH